MVRWLQGRGPAKEGRMSSRTPTWCAAAIASIAMDAMSGQAWAQPRQTADTTFEATGPSTATVGSGVGIFVFSYVPAVFVGASSGLAADRSLLVPLAGPWIDLTQRRECGPLTSCTKRSLRIAPGKVGTSGYGLWALGTF